MCKTKVYLDVYFGVNFMMDCFLIITYTWIINYGSTFVRIIAAGLIGAVTSCVVLVLGKMVLTSFVCSTLSCAGIILVLYYKRIYLGGFKLIRMMALWYINAFAMGGVFLYLINGKATTIILIRIGSVFVLAMYVLVSRNRIGRFRESNSNVYKVTVVKGNDIIKGFGYYDSGCRVFEPISGKPVIVSAYEWLYPHLSEGEKEYIKMFPKLPSEWDGKTVIRSIPYRTVGDDSGFLPAIPVDRVIYERGNRRAMTGKCFLAVCEKKIASANDYDFLLNCEMKLGG